MIDDPDQIERLDRAYGEKYVEPVTGEHASLAGGPTEVVYAVAVRRIMTWVYGNVAARTDWHPP